MPCAFPPGRSWGGVARGEIILYICKGASEAQRSMKEARTAYRREIDGLEHCYCRPCKAYLPSRCFHASALRVKRRRCKSCYEKHKRARSSPVARLLKNLRQRLRRTNPALARRWEEQDILAVLHQDERRAVSRDGTRVFSTGANETVAVSSS